MIHRRPAKFIKYCTYEPEPGEPATLAGVDVSCDIETSDKVKHSVEVNVSGDNIHFTLTADTDNWSLGKASLDLRFATNGLDWWTDITEVEVRRTITRKPTP